ncbi:MAG: transglutaminase domain-containing protein [Clostridia bacterium]|nr:transglutaminase domain-containing protein [Clostridia bacterium]
MGKRAFFNTVPKKLGAEYWRMFLSERGRTIYDAVLSDLIRGDLSGYTELNGIRYPITAFDDAFDAYHALKDDHPEYFFLGQECNFISDGKSAAITYTVLYTAKQTERISNLLKKEINRITNKTAGLNDLEREAVVYGRIAKSKKYADHNDDTDHNAVGPLLSDSGVCEGINALLMLCLRRLNIPCIKVSGKSKKGGLHCWCIAWIDSIPVHIDVTEDLSDKLVCYDYFNLSERMIANNRTIFRKSKLPICSSEHLTYYNYRDLNVKDFSELVALLRKGFAENTSVLVHFDYVPKKSSCISEEIKRALNSAKIYGSHLIRANTELGNAAVLKSDA